MDQIEPNLVTDPRLAPVVKELIAREPIFHRPELETSREHFENMTDPEFWEVGASGRQYSREYVLASLETRYSVAHEDNWKTQDFHCLEIAPNNYLLTYTLVQGERVTRRPTIWRRHGNHWRIVYHQGTIVEDADKLSA